MAPRRIALLDPDGDSRSYVAQALRDDGYAVAVATNGEELLRALDDARYDVVLVDPDRLGMPFDRFVRRARGMPLVRVGVRAPDEPGGWDASLTKPFLMKDLYDAVDSALGAANGARSSAPISSAGSS